MHSAIKGGFVIATCWLGLAYIYKGKLPRCCLTLSDCGSTKSVPRTVVKVCFLRIVGWVGPLATSFLILRLHQPSGPQGVRHPICFLQAKEKSPSLPWKNVKSQGSSLPSVKHRPCPLNSPPYQEWVRHPWGSVSSQVGVWSTRPSHLI